MPKLKPLSRATILKTLIGAAVCAVLVVVGLPPRAVSRSSAEQLPASASSSTAGYNATAFRIAMEDWGETLSYNPYAPAGYIFNEYVQLPLAILSGAPSKSLPNQYFYPELASSWTLGRQAITVHLRAGAKWSDGAPFTSTDVRDSLLLAGEDYNQAWASISDVKTPSRRTLVIDLRPDSVPLNVWTDVVQIPIVPASQYKQLVPSAAQSWIVQYWNLYKDADPTAASMAAANNSQGGKELAKLAAEIPKFAPSRLIGDGPYVLSHANSDEVLLKKWPGFWDSKKISAPWIEFLSVAEVGTTFGDLMGNRIDAEGYSIFADSEVEELEHSQYGRYDKFVTPGNASVVIFHLADYPYNLLDVRKAIAYYINRPRLTHLESGGELEQNQPSEVSDGLTNPMTNRYLTKQQRDSLQAYNYDPAKAAKLLEAVGFHKRDGQWYTSKGKPWALTLYVESSQERMDNDALALTAMFRQAGIKASVDMVQAATFSQQILEGEYPISVDFNDIGSLNPLDEIADTLIQFNYPVADAGNGSGSGHAAIGIGPIANVPGLGRVNIESALTKELATATANHWSQYVWDWARFENENLPGFTVSSTNVHLLYSVNRYTDFPPVSAQRTEVFNVVWWMQAGYLRLRTAKS